ESVYKEQGTIPYLRSDQKREDVCASFINLAILTHKEIEEDPQKRPLDSRDFYLNSFESLYQVKKEIKLQDIFSSMKKEPPRRHLLVTGRAGIGKSTLCQYIANAWVDPERRHTLLVWGEQFEVVVWIK